MAMVRAVPTTAVIAAALTGGTWSAYEATLRSLAGTGLRRWLQYIAFDKVMEYTQLAQADWLGYGNAAAVVEEAQAVAGQALVAQQVMETKLDTFAILAVLYGIFLLALVLGAVAWRRSENLRNSLRESCEMFVKKKQKAYLKDFSEFGRLTTMISLVMCAERIFGRR